MAEEIHILEREVEEACTLLKLNPDEFGQHIKEEKAYLESLKKPPPEVEAKGCYVEALNELRRCRYVNSGTNNPNTQFYGQE